jgi:hypothetical protein
MSRLLFAAARGARIQGNHTEVPVSLLWIDNTVEHGMEYRIHPDDAHLAYGPISTALREYADTGKTQYTLTAMLAMAAYNHEKEYPFILASEWPHAAMFALILAEALADEGL